jgi:probable rRNA maturation factor
VGDLPSPTGVGDQVTVVGADEQAEVAVDVVRWVALAEAALRAEGAVGELTLTFVDRDEIAALNEEHLGHVGPTDVLSFPLDDEPPLDGTPALLGDVVVCPGVAVDQFADHAGTLDDELALLVVHGVLHVLGHDHAEADERARMRARERALLEAHHWAGPAPAGFRHGHDGDPA